MNSARTLSHVRVRPTRAAAEAIEIEKVVGIVVATIGICHSILCAFRFNFEVLLDSSLSLSDVPLQSLWAMRVDDKRRIGALMSVLPPLPPSLFHLKRIHQGVILIAIADEPVSASICSKISEMIGKEVDFFVQKVSAVKPKTRAQFESAKQVGAPRNRC